MKIYIISSKWQHLHISKLRVFDNLEDLIVYAWDELEEKPWEWNPDMASMYITNGLFSCYEVIPNLDTQPTNITRYIKQHFVVEEGI